MPNPLTKATSISAGPFDGFATLMNDPANWMRGEMPLGPGKIVPGVAQAAQAVEQAAPQAVTGLQQLGQQASNVVSPENLRELAALAFKKFTTKPW